MTDSVTRQLARDYTRTSGLMVYFKINSGFLHFLGGRCGMEIAVLLLLTLPLTAASPLRPAHRSDAALQASGLENSEDSQEQQHVPLVKIIPYHSEDKRQGMDAASHSTDNVALKLRLRRASQRGCQLGTCQLHNLANTLYHIGNTSGKDESKKANDPQGFGR